MERTITDFAEAVRTETIKKLGRDCQITIETKKINNKGVCTGLHIRKKAWNRKHWFIWTVISGSTGMET